MPFIIKIYLVDFLAKSKLILAQKPSRFLGLKNNQFLAQEPSFHFAVISFYERQIIRGAEYGIGSLGLLYNLILP